MSTPTSRWVDARMTEAVDSAIIKLDRYVRDGYCEAQDVTEALENGWGEGVAEAWREWLAEESS